ncbi:MAG: hypothetical protein COA50_01950 [Flavobacteriaceae bacterium]|nr:MAG: hypothetical protein COA50_01950 [Flavobacteriaceae bacterium]
MALEPSERPSKSIVKFESMLKTDDVYFFDAEDFEDIIHHYLNNGKVSLAKKAIKIGLRQHPNRIELKLLNVEVHVFENNLELAEQQLDSLQLLDSNNEEIYIQRANIYSKKDNHEAAVELLKKALVLTENDFEIFALLGMEYLFMDNYEMAKENFIKCVAMDEQDYASLYNVIYCFEFMEDLDGGIHYLNDYLERNPYCEVAWHQLGKMYYTKEMYPEAITAFDFAIISDESFIGPYYEKGKVLEKIGKYNEAIENYEITIEIEDPTSHAYLRIGRCHEKLNNHDLAKHFYYRTVHEDPLLDKGWLAITEFHYVKSEYQKALYYINKAINIDEENPLYWKKSGKIYAALKNYSEADFSFKQTVELGNYDLDTWLYWGNVTYKGKDLKSAIQILEQGVEFYPESSELYYKMAGVYLLDNNIEEACSSLTNALLLNTDDFAIFQNEFPQFSGSKVVTDIVNDIKKASR